LDENQKDAMKLSQICRRREEDNPSFWDEFTKFTFFFTITLIWSVAALSCEGGDIQGNNSTHHVNKK
jgi:hypothetical protein